MNEKINYTDLPITTKDSRQAIERSNSFYLMIKKIIDTNKNKINLSKKQIILTIAALVSFSTEVAASDNINNNHKVPSITASELPIKLKEPTENKEIKKKFEETIKKFGGFLQDTPLSEKQKEFFTYLKNLKQSSESDYIEVDIVFDEYNNNMGEKHLVILNFDKLIQHPVIIDGNLKRILITGYNKDNSISFAINNPLKNKKSDTNDLFDVINMNYENKTYEIPFFQKKLKNLGSYEKIQFLISNNLKHNQSAIKHLMPIVHDAIAKIQDLFNEKSLPIQIVEILDNKYSPSQAMYSGENTLGIILGPEYLKTPLLHEEITSRTVIHEVAHRQDDILYISKNENSEEPVSLETIHDFKKLMLLKYPGENTKNSELVKLWYNLKYKKTIYDKSSYIEVLDKLSAHRGLYPRKVYSDPMKHTIYTLNVDFEKNIKIFNESEFFNQPLYGGGHVQENTKEFFASLFTIITNSNFEKIISSKPYETQILYMKALISLQRTLQATKEIKKDSKILIITKKRINYLNKIISKT